MDLSSNTIALMLVLLLTAGNAGNIRGYLDEIVSGTQHIATAGDLRSIAQMLDLHYIRKGRYPGSQDFKAWMRANFKENQLKELDADHWGHALIYRAGADLHSFELISAGPDGVPDTADDLRYTGP